jgi:hypothetical protein
MNDLYSEAQAVRMLAKELEGEDDEGIQLAVESETGFVEAAEAVLGAIRDAETMRDAARERAKAIEARAAIFDRRQERLRTMLMGAMVTAGVKTLRLAEGTLSVSEAPATAVVTDETALPLIYQVEKTTSHPNMRMITETLRAGVDVPGAALRNGAPRLTVRIR